MYSHLKCFSLIFLWTCFANEWMLDMVSDSRVLFSWINRKMRLMTDLFIYIAFILCLLTIHSLLYFQNFKYNACVRETTPVNQTSLPYDINVTSSGGNPIIKGEIFFWADYIVHGPFWYPWQQTRMGLNSDIDNERWKTKCVKTWASPPLLKKKPLFPLINEGLCHKTTELHDAFGTS